MKNKSTVRKHTNKAILIERYGQKCFYCQQPKKYKELTLDHVYPRSKLSRGTQGREISLSNLLLACYPCNELKGDRVVSPLQFQREMTLWYWKALYAIKKAFKGYLRCTKRKFVFNEKRYLEKLKTRSEGFRALIARVLDNPSEWNEAKFISEYKKLSRVRAGKSHKNRRTPSRGKSEWESLRLCGIVK